MSERIILRYKCPFCGSEMDKEEGFIYCPICNKESLEVYEKKQDPCETCESKKEKISYFCAVIITLFLGEE